MRGVTVGDLAAILSAVFLAPEVPHCFDYGSTQAHSEKRDLEFSNFASFWIDYSEPLEILYEY